MSVSPRHTHLCMHLSAESTVTAEGSDTDRNNLGLPWTLHAELFTCLKLLMLHTTPNFLHSLEAPSTYSEHSATANIHLMLTGSNMCLCSVIFSKNRMTCYTTQINQTSELLTWLKKNHCSSEKAMQTHKLSYLCAVS